MTLKVSSPWKTRTPPEDLIKDAVDLLGLAGEPNRGEARANIQKIADEYAEIFGDAMGPPSISDARKNLKTWADQAEKLAGSFRADINSMIYGSATNDPAGNHTRTKKDQQEIDESKSEVLAAASQLDKIALTFRERRNRWQKNTGQLTSYQMVRGNPKEPFALACVHVFAVHRPDDVKADKKGDLYRFIELIFELTSGDEPKGDELLRSLRWAVAEYKKSLPQSQ